MDISCPHCRAPLSLSAEQQHKLDQALSRLQPNSSLNIKCPQCQKNFPMGPALQKEQKKETRAKSKGGVEPPPPPPLDWLQDENALRDEKMQDIPMALVLYEPGAERDSIASTLKNFGYQIIVEKTSSDALARMRFSRFACIVFHADLESPIQKSPFHIAMCAMNMEQRRNIFYILIGSDLHTLYNLEALAYSANLTVNTNEIPSLDKILRPAILSYEELFGPLLEEINSHCN